MKAILLSLIGLFAISVGALAQGEKKVKMNEPFWFGNFQYTFTGARESKELATKYSKKKPTEGAAFLVVYYTVENMTHEPVSGFSGDFEKFKVKDKNGRTFNPSRTLISYTGEKSIMELPPGLPMKTAAVFEMPLSSFEGDASFTVIIPENGDFSGETRELTFRKKAKESAEESPAATETKGKGKGKASAKSKSGT